MINIEEKKRYVKDYFSKIQFNEKYHTYYHEDSSLKPVSLVIKDYVKEIDFDKIAFYTAKKRGVHKSVVLAEWKLKKDNACNTGTKVHSFGETFNESSQANNGLEEAVSKYWNELPKHIVPFLFELKMYSKDLGIAGTTDILLYNTLTDKFILADYKSNGDLFKNYKGSKLLYPFNNLLDSPFNKYQIQLSLYQYLFEQCGLEIESRQIIWLLPDGSYQIYETIDLRKELVLELTKDK